ncbi:MAG: tRNA pseudouridine(38-40) synthase TruA [Firmicutes bacterium]|nr:tRNA pseudouridine(38-40) synthase TruA [Bacillota bacterium]
MGGEVRNIRLVLEYDGTGYHGFQAQDDTDLPTIQGELEAAIEIICHERLRIIGSGRTDAGVHALGQVVNFYTRSSVPTERFPAALNSVLPRDIRVKTAEAVPLEFHARFDAIAKTYVYLVDNRPLPSVFLRNYAYHVSQPLDVEAMHRAADLLVGTQDYASFRTSGSSAKTSVRTVYEFDIEESKAHDGIIKFRVRADGFLYNMMRNMVGTLLEVGLGKLSVADVAAVLKARDRRLAGPTAPACGLYLVEVEYPSFVSSSGS